MIRFTISERGLMPAEKEKFREAASELPTGKRAAERAGGVAEERWLKSLRPQMYRQGHTVDAVKFQSDSRRLPGVLPEGELMAALSTLQRVMLHELKLGHDVTLPYIGTFSLSLKGGIELRETSDGEGRYYHGRDVRVDNLVFRPDRELLSEVRDIPVDQTPVGRGFHLDEDEINAHFTELFALHETATHKDVSWAFEGLMTRNRITYLLRRLVRDGRLIALGSGAQTTYRPAPGHFGR